MKDFFKQNKIQLLFLSITISIVFLFYFRTIFYGIKTYDELFVFKESLFPIFHSFSEMFEFISLLGLNHHFEAMNTLYSNIVSLRCNPIGNFMQLFIECIFKKNPIYYHLYSLSLHLINTSCVFLIIHKTGKLLNRTISSNTPTLVTTTLFTLLWALHPANIESVLLLTNANIILSYTLCFLIFVFYIFFFQRNEKLLQLNFAIKFAISLLYLCALFLAEFHFVFPFILILYLTCLNMFLNHPQDSFKKAFFKSLSLSCKSVSPLLFGTGVFISIFTFSRLSINLQNQSSLDVILERVFWLSPQVFFHYIKLIFFPIKLSIDQSFHVMLGKSIFDPYSIFCLISLILILFLSFRSLIYSTKRFHFFFIAIFLFFLSLIPFLHILAPLYNLASERYLYFPSFVLIFGFAHYVMHLLSRNNLKTTSLVSIALVIITLIYSVRAYVRTFDWKDSFTLYNSAIKATNNPLYKAFRYSGLTKQEKIFARYPLQEVEKEYQDLAVENVQKAINTLKEETNKYQASTPAILKAYGLDPETLLVKAGFFLVQIHLSLSRDFESALERMKPYTNDLSLLDSSALKLYGSTLLINHKYDEAEKVLRYGLEKYPFSTRMIFPLCDLIQSKYNDLDEIEKLALRAFQLYPYDTFTLFVLTKIYELKKDTVQFAKFSYLYGLRTHSLESLQNAYKSYLVLGNSEVANKVKKRILEMENLTY